MVVSICGPSNAGKSQLAKATARLLGEETSCRVPVDYFLLSRPADGRLVWDWNLLAVRLALPVGTETTTPDLDFDTLSRRSHRGGLPFTIRPVMICDAMEPYPGSDLVVLLDVPVPVRRERMVERDRRWGTTVAERSRELDATWRSVAGRVHPDLTLNGELPLIVLATELVGTIRRRWEAGGRTMTDRSAIRTGTSVVALDGESLGTVREVQDYYILVDQPDAHADLKVPSDAVGEMGDGVLHLTVNRSALSAVDDEESAHREIEEPDA